MKAKGLIGSVLVTLLTGLSDRAPAREITVPMKLDHGFLRQVLVSQVYTDPGESLRAWDDGSGCNFLILSDPKIDSRKERLRIVTAGNARVGTAVGERCLAVFEWEGYLEMFEEPVLDPAAPVVHFRIRDSNIYNRRWKKELLTGTLWDWIKQYVHPRVERVRVDLAFALDELRAFLPLVLGGEEAHAVQALIDSLKLVNVSTTEDGLSMQLRLTVDPLAVPLPTEPEPALDEAELKQFDAFLTSVIRSIGNDAHTQPLRSALLEVLIEGRYDILQALGQTVSIEEDPTRRLFLRTWKRLAGPIREISFGLPGEHALRYLTFIAAADALNALDEIGPQVGIEISAEGLRRLARMLAPAPGPDPLVYSEEVDAELRRVLGFGPPLEEPLENPALDNPGSWWIFAAPAYAASDPDRVLAEQLNRWVPSLNEIDRYLPMVHKLLNYAALTALTERDLPSAYHTMFRHLVLATAWQETCWRQFVKNDSRIVPIRSPAGSLGLMQVNPTVWRGFYDVDGLKRDISYNARAGIEILFHYLVDYALPKKEHKATNDAHSLARATYAAYNGGPRHLTRYREATTKKHLRQIDQAFWDKYQTVSRGDELGVIRCYRPS